MRLVYVEVLLHMVIAPTYMNLRYNSMFVHEQSLFLPLFFGNEIVHLAFDNKPGMSDYVS